MSLENECVKVHCPYKLTLIELFGWGGAILLTIGYYLIQTQKVNSNSIGYLLLNIIGSFMLFINAMENRAYPSLAINFIWFIIGIIIIYQLYK